MTYTIAYYSEAVQSEILALPAGILSDYLRLADLLEELGPAIRLPYSRAMGEGLFELRPHGREGIGRVFYCYLVGQRIVMLHSFVKKTQETPRKELRIAQARQLEVKNADAC